MRKFCAPHMHRDCAPHAHSLRNGLAEFARQLPANCRPISDLRTGGTFLKTFLRKRNSYK